jgi:hypothetical protein
MGVNIVDPLTGDGARVNARSSLLTDAVSRSDFIDAMLRGDAYDVEVNDVPLTTATADRALLYMMNANQNAFLVINALFLSFGVSTGGTPPASGLLNFRVVANPTLGTLITAGTPLTARNRNIGSGKIAAGSFKGHTGDQTVTDGVQLFKQELVVATSPAAAALLLPFAINPFLLDIALSPNQAVAFTFSPPAGNTSMIANLGASFSYAPLDTFRTAAV